MLLEKPIETHRKTVVMVLNVKLTVFCYNLFICLPSLVAGVGASDSLSHSITSIWEDMKKKTPKHLINYLVILSVSWDSFI